ncbi:MAG: exonuclease domain-containing protein [Burkholderiales bacterium]|nr:exonuclease domain-containing protein [Burkholderiales bacterium]
MSDRAAIVIAFAVTLAIVAAVAGLTGGFVWAGLRPDERAAAVELLAPRAGLLAFVGLIATGLASLAVQPVIRTYFTGARRLAEEARIMLDANPDYRIARAGAPGLRELGEAVNTLAERLRGQREEVEARIAAAKASVEEERNRLAALMSELIQGVLVCNAEGRILLYNARARQLFDTDSTTEAAPVGLGRSIFGLIDRNLVVHALDAIAQRCAQGDVDPVVQFLTATRGGRWLRIHVAQVRRHAGRDGAEAAEEAGFVLTLDDVTRAVEDDSRRDRALHSLSEGIRAPLANIRAAVESLLEYADMAEAQRARFLGVIAEEARALSSQLDRTMHEHADALKTRLPLESVLGTDLIGAAQRRIESRLGMRAEVETADASVWLEAESFSLTQGLAYLAGRLKREFGVEQVRFRLERAGRHAQLDLAWHGAAVPPATLRSWEEEPMRAGGEDSPVSFKEVIERHAGEVWHNVGDGARAPCFRILLPAMSAEPAQRRVAPVIDSRPEYYDFDLFRQPGQSPDLDSRPLAELAYTVFDTETTGLEPSAGDEIIAIGAVRIVNLRLLRHEAYEQLVDPRRPLAQASIRIHGITPEMLEGQPTIDRVLPAFLKFSEDTVLIAHNAAFDMRFLQLKEAATGVRFTQPVLDTLLLSEVLHPNIREHRLEAIAERLGVNIVGRHTALGDAIVTGEVFLRMVPLLAERGIRTLGEARAAAEKTFYARVKY